MTWIVLNGPFISKPTTTHFIYFTLDIFYSDWQRQNTGESNICVFQMQFKFTITSVWAKSAVDKLMIFFSFFPENRLWHFMQIVSKRRQFAWNVKAYFLGKRRKIIQNVCWKCHPACKVFIYETDSLDFWDSRDQIFWFTAGWDHLT